LFVCLQASGSDLIADALGWRRRSLGPWASPGACLRARPRR
jgi:hypothetical protein